MKKLQITVRREIYHGKERIRPLCEKANLFAGLAGSVFLTPDAILVIMRLGYDVVYEMRAYAAQYNKGSE